MSWGCPGFDSWSDLFFSLPTNSETGAAVGKPLEGHTEPVGKLFTLPMGGTSGKAQSIALELVIPPTKPAG